MFKWFRREKAPDTGYTTLIKVIIHNDDYAEFIWGNPHQLDCMGLADSRKCWCESVTWEKIDDPRGTLKFYLNKYPNLVVEVEPKSETPKEINEEA